VQIRFEAPAARYERGDFWQIPARTATSGVLWPQSRDEEPAPLAIIPDGPPSYRAPLALVRELPGDPVDLRVLFGYRAGEHEGSPEPDHPTVQREALLADATTVIRPAIVSYLVRSVSTFEPGAVFAVQDGTTIGRTPDADIYLDHPAVSRHHAVFRLQDDTLVITDLGSTNGTAVNQQPLAAQVPVTLSPGDTIQVGGSPEIQLRVEEA
jgi:FHA domain